MIDVVNLFGSDESKLFNELCLEEAWQEVYKDYNL